MTRTRACSRSNNKDSHESISNNNSCNNNSCNNNNNNNSCNNNNNNNNNSNNSNKTYCVIKLAPAPVPQPISRKRGVSTSLMIFFTASNSTRP